MSPAKKPPKSADESEKPKSKKGETQPVINTDTLCDENWKCDVVFVHEGDKDGSVIVNMLLQIPTKQILGSIKVINKNDVLKDVKKGGGKIPKKGGSAKSQKSKDEEVELTDEQKIMKSIKEMIPIPGEPLASVIKKCLIKLKVDDINDRRKELSAFESSQKKKTKPVSKGNKKGQKEEPLVEVETPKEVFVERPPLFVILLGFSEYDLPIELVKQDVPICAVMKIIVMPIPDTVKNNLETNHNLMQLSSNKFNMTWISFWKKFDDFMNIPENADLGNDLAIIKYRAPFELVSSEVNMKDKKNYALNELTNIMNYVRNLLELYKFYSENLIMLELGEELAPDVNTDLYETLIQMVPLECVSIPIILFSLIEQVCHWNENESDTESRSTVDSSKITSENDKENSSWSTNNTFHNNIKRNRSQSIPKSRIKCHPVIIRHNDEHSLKTFHLEIPEIDFNAILIRFLSKMFLLKAWLVKKEDSMQKYFFEFQLQRLFKLSYKDIHLKLFYIYLHCFILCKMDSYSTWQIRNAKTVSNGTIVDGSTGLPYNFSYNNKLLQDWMNKIEINEQTTMSETLNDDVDNERAKKTSNVSNDNDDNNDNAMSSNNNGNVDDDKPVTNSDTSSSNDNDSLHLSKRDHHCKFQSGTNFRGVETIKKERNHNLMILKKFLYCSEVLCLWEDTEIPIIMNYLKSFTNYKYIEEMTPLSLLQSLQEALFNYSHIQSLYYYPSNKILLRFHNSKDFIFEEHKSGRLDSVLGFRDYYSSVIEPEENNLLKQNEMLGKVGAKPDDQTETKHDSQDNTPGVSKENEKIRAYNVGKKMVKFDQTTRKFSSSDGSNVTVTIEDWYRSSQSVNICIRKIDTEMIIHLDKLLLMKDYSNIVNTPIETMKLFLRLPNEILLNVRVEEITEGLQGEPGSTRFIYNDLTVTIPTGLVIQVVKNRYDNNVYIKQSYTAKGPSCNKIWDEKCRCFDRSGSIIIFKNDDTIDVIYGSTALGRINKIDESVIKEEIVEEPKEKIEKVKTDKTSTKTGPKVTEDSKQPIEQQIEEVQMLPYKITEHSIKSWSGISYVYKDGSCTEATDSNISLRTIFCPYKQLYMDRNDGVKCLFTDDGKLVSTHNDGTKLMTYMHEEPELLLQDSHDFRQDSQIHVEAEQEILCPEDISRDTFDLSSSYFRIDTEESKYEYEDMFISYKIGCIAEHPNYATVEFSPSDDSIKLTLPENLMITVHDVQSNGSYEFTVNINKKASIKFTKDSIRFESNILKKSKKLNITTISPILITNTIINDYTHFCKTIDSFHRTFAVDKDGEIMLQEPEFGDDEMVAYRDVQHTRNFDSYYENAVPRKITERFFVVNDNFSGYEIINQSDIQILDKDDEKRFKSMDTTKSPTNNRISSKTNQYYVYKSHSDSYLLKQQFANIVPQSFQRADLGPPWTPAQSPWFFTRTDIKRIGYRHFSYSDIAKHDDDRIRAVVIKTIQQVSDSNSFNALEIILNCLERYKKESEKLFEKYKQQGFTDFDVDTRLKENQELVCSIKKEIPLWNVLTKDCNICKHSFGSPNKRAGSVLDGPNITSEFEKVVNKTDY